MSGSNCCFLTCIQISQEAGKVVWYTHLFKNFPQFVLIHTVNGFDIVNKAQVGVCLELSCFFFMIQRMLGIRSLVPLPFLNPVWIWKFSVHVLLKPGLEIFECYTPRLWDECNYEVVWALFGIAFLRDWNENWPFPVLWPLLSFPNLMACWVQHFSSSIFQNLK